MEYTTVRNPPPVVADTLEKEKLRRGKSLNQTWRVSLRREAEDASTQNR